jgi:Putative adhesin
MSNQQMQFSEPEWQPPEQHNINDGPGEQGAYTPQPINLDAREQPTMPPPTEQEGEGYGYIGERPYIGPQPEKIGVDQYPRRQYRRRRSPLFWIILVLIVVAIFGVVPNRRMGGFGMHSNSIPETKTFTVSASIAPTIMITDSVGTIHVHTGDATQVTIQATKHNNGFFGGSNNTQVKYGEGNNTIDVNVENGGGFFGSGSVDFDVTVPTNTNLTLRTDTGAINVDGVTGQESLISDTGVINATSVHLTGPSTLKTDTGAINFNGTIDTTTGGTYRFEADTGAVNVTLPGNSTFHLDASTDTGAFNTTFPGVNVQHPDITGSRVTQDVGSAPSATMIVRTDTGAINLNQS